MVCSEFEKMIPEFIHKRMDFATTKCFTEHLRSCPNCKEELNIQFLIDEGLVRLEQGSAFDLQKEMRELLNDAQRKVRFHERFLKFGKMIEALVILAIFAVVLAIILL